MKFEYIYGIKCWDKFPKVTISIEVITPETAIAMLETNVHNRSMKRTAIAEDVRDGNWELNGETIVFSDEGVLLDGQNRLAACIEANKPIVTIVVRGISAEAQMTIDTGIKRQVADQLKMLGYKDPNFVAAAGTALLKADTFGIEAAMTHGGGRKISLKQTVAFIDGAYEKRIKPIYRDVRNVSHMYKGTTSSILVPLFDAFRNVDIESYAIFVDMMLLKCNPAKPVRLLVAKLSDNAQKKQGRLPNKIVGALVIKAWNAYMLGEDKVLLKFSAGGAHPESFPEIFMGW